MGRSAWELFTAITSAVSRIRPRATPSISSAARPPAAGSASSILLKCSSTKAHCAGRCGVQVRIDSAPGP